MKKQQSIVKEDRAKNFRTVITVSKCPQAFDREGCIFYSNPIHVCFDVMLSTLSADELGLLLEHSQRTTNLIHAAYIKKCATGVTVNEIDKETCDSDST